MQTVEELPVPIDAADIMTRPVVSARPDSTVAEVAKLLNEHDISAVPVCAEDGTLLGMISDGDLMRPFGQDYALRRTWWLGLLAGGDALVRTLADYLQTDRRQAGDLMTHPAITAADDATLGEIAELLMCHRIKRVPIVKDGKLVGIVSRANLINALAVHPAPLADWEWPLAMAGSDNPAPKIRPPPPEGEDAAPSPR